MANPPKDAPSVAELAQARANAEGYVVSINDNGYGDKSSNDFTARSKNLMAPSHRPYWTEIEEMGTEGADSEYWKE